MMNDLRRWQRFRLEEDGAIMGTEARMEMARPRMKSDTIERCGYYGDRGKVNIKRSNGWQR